jgi:hypothetical protein
MLVSRPIDGAIGSVGAHTFLAVVPENPGTIGSINGVNTGQAFTLGGYTSGNGDLFRRANAGSDYAYAFGDQKGASQVIVVPPKGISAEEFDQRVVGSYNSMPGTISDSYGFMGQKRLTENPNSNNVTTDILLGAGVSTRQINNYQGQLFASNFPRVTPGLGTSASAPTYSQSLGATLNSLKSALTQLLGVLSSKK